MYSRLGFGGLWRRTLQGSPHFSNQIVFMCATPGSLRVQGKRKLQVCLGIAENVTKTIRAGIAGGSWVAEPKTWGSKGMKGSTVGLAAGWEGRRVVMASTGGRSWRAPSGKLAACCTGDWTDCWPAPCPGSSPVCLVGSCTASVLLF